MVYKKRRRCLLLRASIETGLNGIGFDDQVDQNIILFHYVTSYSEND